MNLIRKSAPKFRANAVINGKQIVEKFGLDQYLGRKNGILFFYPKDFSSICQIKIRGFQEKPWEFEKRESIVTGYSADSEETHLACLDTCLAKGGIKGITFPLIADVSKTIALNYGILGAEYAYENEKKVWSFNGVPVALRSTFLIDKDGIIRHQTINDFSFEKNADEYLYLIDALYLVKKMVKNVLHICRNGMRKLHYHLKMAMNILFIISLTFFNWPNPNIEDYSSFVEN